MIDFALVGVVLLGGIVIGIGSLFLAMGFLTAFLKRMGVGVEFTPVLPPSRRNAEIPSSNMGRLHLESQVISDSIPDSKLEGMDQSEGAEIDERVQDATLPGVGQQELDAKIVAAISATLCAGGFIRKNSQKIKEVRFVN
ncbi:hypothetical protein CEB3_c46970 [Peptococcaceae bacterium CEB3]|nr:hypothetical protein CEB3_c46970 [Peptococcaceae bacterium CEB3]